MKKLSIYKTPLYLCIFILFIGCKSSSGSADKAPEEVIAVPPSVPPVEAPTEPPVAPINSDITCTGLAKLNIVEANATNSLNSYTANQVIDAKFLPESRWSSLENSAQLTLTLENLSLVKGLSITWLNTDQRSYSYDVEVSKDKQTWTSVVADQITDALTTRSQFIEIAEHSAQYIKIIPKGSNIDSTNNIIEVEAFGCSEDVSSTIELTDWYLSIPVDERLNTKAESIYESRLNNDYFNAEFFFMNNEGGLVFRSPIEGAKTSTNTKYTRTELREMLRRGDTNINVKGVNKNNWVFSSAPENDLDAAGGVDGELIAELAVNHVTETGDKSQVGRVIIGQIHANNDEPIRVYYRKLPGNNKGSIYLAHEIEGGDDIYYELIGNRSQSATNPENGIALNERFGYQIKVVANLLTLTITRAGKADVTQVVDMTNSGYDQGGQYMYFKAGAYNQNNTGNAKDYVQTTFYKISNSHTGYQEQ